MGTSWSASDLRQGDLILWIEGGDGFWQPILQSVESNTALTLAEPWEGPTLTGVRYRIRYQWDSSRVSAQARQLIEMLDNGNILALAGLTGPGVPVFNGPHSMIVKPETDFVNGVAYDAQVDTLADRAAYDGQAEGFSVLVSNIGDGRSALYSKASNSVGDWSVPAYITGPVGPLPTLEAGTTTTLPPGSNATFTVNPVTGGYQLNAGIPAGEGFYNAGAYNIANAYNQSDVVRHNRSSFIALQAVPAGQSPSSVYPPVDTAYWQVLVMAGQDGTGTGDVVGPASATDHRLAVFSGTTGKLIDQASGLNAAQMGQARTDLGMGPLTESINKIMNGGFLVNQRTSGSGSIPAGSQAFVCDRWSISNNTNQTLNWSIASTYQYAVSSDAKNGLVASFTVAPTTGTVSISQHIEDVRTLSFRQATFGFYLLENAWGAGTAFIDQNFGSGGSAAVGAGSFAITAGGGSKKGTLTFPEVHTKTVGTNSYLNVVFLFSPRAVGPLFLTSAGLVEGDQMAETNAFPQRSVSLETMLCRRYCRRAGTRAITTAAATGSFLQSDMDISDMRTVPTVLTTSTADILTNATAVDAVAFVQGASKIYRTFSQSVAAGFSAFSAERLLDSEL